MVLIIGAKIIAYLSIDFSLPVDKQSKNMRPAVLVAGEDGAGEGRFAVIFVSLSYYIPWRLGVKASEYVRRHGSLDNSSSPL
jgi:hypothetical protein